LSEMPKVMSIFKPMGNRWTIVERRRDKTILCPAMSVEVFQCNCGFETGFPFEMLLHLRDHHGFNEFEATNNFRHRDEDDSREYFENKKGEKIPESIEIVEKEEL